MGKRMFRNKDERRRRNIDRLHPHNRDKKELRPCATQIEVNKRKDGRDEHRTDMIKAEMPRYVCTC